VLVTSLRLFATLLALAGTAFPGDPRQEARASEYQVKAAFIYNFAKFVEWPPDAVRAEEGAFVITILGGDPFGAILDDTLRGRTLNTQRIILRRAARVEDVGDSRIVFISDSENEKLPRILKRLAGAAILTVGEMDHFAERGGIVGFKTDDKDRIRLEINAAVAEQARLRISSELLKLARIVKQRGAG
jgi:YfiR/HmsC-like